MAQITLRDYLQETEDAIGTKQIEKALANCQSILAYFPDSLEGQRLLGEVYLAQGRLEDAQHAFDWVLSNDPENVIAYCSRALVSERQSDYDTALDCYQQAYELSRGNSRIRQAFNELSERVGQQGFMLSRAGLARLYMRGDLLAQSIQEWEVVLAAMPDRLDARTGLLEVYWREGFYDQASQLASQILKDVPGCLKALVLLAHVTAPQDMLQSQELMKRAEALDPDLVMAHNLFADHIASQSRDPFLKLLKKPPVIIGEDVARLETVKGMATPVESPAVQEHAYTSASASPSDALATWGNVEGWSNDTTLIKPHFDEVDQLAVPSFANWNASAGSHTSDILQNSRQSSGGSASDPQWSTEAANSWSTFQPDMRPVAPSNGGNQPEPWQLLQNTLNNINPEVVWSQPAQDEQEEVVPSRNDVLSSQPTQEIREHVEEVSGRVASDTQTADSQAFSMQEENDPLFSMQEENDPLAPPAWLSMLTQTERNQLSGVMPAINLAEQRQTAPQVVPQPQAQIQPQAEPEPAHDNRSWSPSIGSDAGEGDAGEEGSLFGPDWLKSLGAATLDNDNDQADELSMVAPAPQVPSETSETVKPQEEVYETWDTRAEQAPSRSVDELWTASSLSQQQEQTKRGSWLDSLSSSPSVEQYEQRDPAQQPWENNGSIGTQSGADSTNGNEGWEGSHYEANAQQNGGSQPSAYLEEQETQEEPWTQQEQPKRGSWLDSLSSSPSFEQYEQRTPAQQPWENNPAAEVEQDQKEQAGSESWSSPWSEVEQAQPSWLSQMSELQTQSSSDAWQPLPVEAQPQANEQSEQNLISTLEELEQNLRSRGFIPLEPNSLSTIAQTQNGSPSAEEATHYDAQSYRQEPSLSSALAELGNFIHPAASGEKPNAMPSTAPEQPGVEPSWLASLRAVPAPIPEPSRSEFEVPGTSKQEAGMETSFSYEPQEARPTTNVPSQPPISPVRPDVTFSPTFEATDSLPTRNQHKTLQEAASRINPLLDNELETTMKRPAVRLQPMQKRALPARDLSTQNRGRVAEPAISTSGNGNSGYRERLLRGYQSQLIGDYDNAMQEYRVIIRNTPELLGEVISNLRALLKLAPKYSAGYRVLGDAYMRQGEYLQAMEAYNKALTMAKKAKN